MKLFQSKCLKIIQIWKDEKYSLISGLYTNTYVPVVEVRQVGSNTWYKIPVNLTGNDNIYGYTLTGDYDVKITKYKL